MVSQGAGPFCSYGSNPIYTLDFPELSFYGSSGFGKTFALSTIMMELALKNSPEHLHFYIMDFGNSGLVQFKNLPHTADYMGPDDMEKLRKFIKLMQEEIKSRKRTFAEASAMNFTMYNRIAENKLPAVFLFIDNYDVIKELEIDLEAAITQFTRDGVSLGIYVVITATRTGAVRYSIQNNFKNKIALFLYEESDVQAVVGRTQIPLNEIKGRGFLKLENVNQIQLYTIADSSDLVAYMEAVRTYIQEISRHYTGKTPKAIPVLPEELSVADLRSYGEAVSDHLVPVGLETEQVELKYMDLNQYRQIIVGPAKSGKTNLLKVLLYNIQKTVPVYLVDSQASELITFQSQENVTYINNGEGIRRLQEEMQALINQRKKLYEEEKERDASLIPKLYFETMPPVVLLIENWDCFMEYAREPDMENVQDTIVQSEQYGITVVTTVTEGKMRGYDPATKYMKEAVTGVILGKTNEQTLFDVPYVRDAGEDHSIGHLTRNGKLTKIKIPYA